VCFVSQVNYLKPCVLPQASKKDKSVGVNSVCPRPTPEWQKPIGHFFNVVPRDVKAQADGVGDVSPASPIAKYFC